MSAPAHADSAVAVIWRGRGEPPAWAYLGLVADCAIVVYVGTVLCRSVMGYSPGGGNATLALVLPLLMIGLLAIGPMCMTGVALTGSAVALVARLQLALVLAGPGLLASQLNNRLTRDLYFGLTLPVAICNVLVAFLFARALAGLYRERVRRGRGAAPAALRERR